MEMGTVGEWVAGLLTAIGLAFAAIQIRDHRRSAEQEARMTQEADARSVVAEVLAADSELLAEASILVDNSGSYPVFETQVLVNDDSVDGLSISQPIRVGLIRPGNHQVVVVQLRPPRRPGTMRLSVRFRDTHGTVWQTSEGRLTRIAATSAAESLS